jgi:hypothetical protein
MLKPSKTLRPAIEELERTNYSQELVEVPKRAQLDRAAEGAQFIPPIIVPVEQNE